MDTMLPRRLGNDSRCCSTANGAGHGGEHPAPGWFILDEEFAEAADETTTMVFWLFDFLFGLEFDEIGFFV